ncbi:MAG: di-heme-cytochrome C peroxidase [Acetobacterales bacterium]
MGGVLLSALAVAGCALFPPALPDRAPAADVVWLEQNWTDDARFWFHHATQGTSTIPVPYAWFVALEQPDIHLFSDPPLLSDPAYMSRFGFISSPPGNRGGGKYDNVPSADGTPSTGFTVPYDAAGFAGNPDGLPVGFARTAGYTDPATGEALPDQIGLNCAACHTGQFTYRGTNVRIDGGPATTDLGRFRTVVGLALAYTKYVPGRFSRFADRVLGPGHSPADAAALETALDELLEKGPRLVQQMSAGLEGSVEEGFNRLDALNRIGTQVFYSGLLPAKDLDFDLTTNLHPNNAPVNYPATWSTSWFDWVQYDASIRRPMVRNAGEALGVAARANLTHPGDPALPLYGSSVRFEEIFLMEELLGGPNPQSEPKGFKGLTSPAWPQDILGKIDEDRADKGRALYMQHCNRCHRPPPNDPSGRFWNSAFWTTPTALDLQYYKVPIIPVAVIGTDPSQATVLKERRVKVPSYLGIPEPIERNGFVCGGKPGTTITETSFAWALAAVTGKVIGHWYAENDIPPDEQARLNGYRDNCIQAPFGYKARPLNGVWATAPFLHNGSVPSLYDLLTPAAERPKTFCLGNLEFDPEKVGYDPSCRRGTTKIDTAVKGNWNAGHSFEDGPRRNGVIGPTLTHADRMAIVEFLKTL